MRIVCNFDSIRMCSQLYFRQRDITRHIMSLGKTVKPKISQAGVWIRPTCYAFFFHYPPSLLSMTLKWIFRFIFLPPYYVWVLLTLQDLQRNHAIVTWHIKSLNYPNMECRSPLSDNLKISNAIFRDCRIIWGAWVLPSNEFLNLIIRCISGYISVWKRISGKYFCLWILKIVAIVWISSKNLYCIQYKHKTSCLKILDTRNSLKIVHKKYGISQFVINVFIWSTQYI